MDLSQVKLSATEWGNIEIPVSDQEKSILQLISDGYSNIHIRKNRNLSMFLFMKMEFSPETEYFLYKRYFEKEIQTIQTIYPEFSKIDILKGIPNSYTKPLKKANMIRVENMESNISTNKEQIFEFVLLGFALDLAKSLISNEKKMTSKRSEKIAELRSPAFYLYTLIQLRKVSIEQINQYISVFVDGLIAIMIQRIGISEIFENAYECIEQNPFLLKYEDIALFSHQRDLFRIMNKDTETPKLVLYIAPTATGKTLSPIGLSTKYRIIFICVARHIGLALGKSAISVGKKIAFAFGCETASDIRLHNSAASVYTINSRTGGIGRIDNTVGDKVEIMICDVKSYLTAMHYMLAFNEERNIITYWDEPTITMDYDQHPLHESIHENWKHNMISKVVLSCATLPGENEIGATLADFRARFMSASSPEIHTIRSYDCKKSISLLAPTGEMVLPHLLFRDSAVELLQSIAHCEDNKTLLRYFDLKSIVHFITLLIKNADISGSEWTFPVEYLPDSYFADISEITMNRIKEYYLDILRILVQQSKIEWIYAILSKPDADASSESFRKIKSESLIRSHENLGKPLQRTVSVQSISLKSTPQESKKPASTVQSSGDGILLTTKDAHTLTDGPTLFLANDVEKVGKFYIQQSNIPVKIFQSLREKMTKNTDLQQRIDILEKTKEDKLNSSKSVLASSASDKKDSKLGGKEVIDPGIRQLIEQINQMRNEMKVIRLDPMYVPNMVPHQNIWSPNGKIVKNAFAPSIDSHCVQQIMELDVSNDLKLLLLLGIGVFMECPNVEYMEIMKRLAYEQKLYLIIASSDYIYGTNYQFSHGFIGKDLQNMTQQKIIQAMGRVGRNNIQQDYTVRFRDISMIRRLFLPAVENREGVIMSRLFSQE
jgi:hypothetical protein